MIFTRKKIIFLHLPKTAGNAIQDALELASDDRRVVSKHQDGVHRFGVSGPLKLAKHARLSAYAAALGDDLPSYRVAICCREPFERALSMYFSPHRWLDQDESGRWVARTPFWSLEAFRGSVRKMALGSEFLRVGSAVHTPEWLIRFERLEADFQRFVSQAELSSGPLRLLNTSAARAALHAQARADPGARAIVLDRFETDYDLFGYAKSSTQTGSTITMTCDADP